MSTLDGILARARAEIDALRAESADHARDATAAAERMADPTDRHRALQARERDLLLELGTVQDELHASATVLDEMARERDDYQLKADAAADAADYYEQVTLPGLAAILDGAELPPREALAATGLMPKEPKEVGPPDDAPVCVWCGEPLAPDGDAWLHRRGPRDHPAIPDDLAVPAAPDSPPVVAPPVPHDPAMTIPDTGLSPDPLPPAEDAAQPRHAKPPRRIDVSGAFKAITGRLTADDQDGDRHE